MYADFVSSNFTEFIRSNSFFDGGFRILYKYDLVICTQMKLLPSFLIWMLLFSYLIALARLPVICSMEVQKGGIPILILEEKPLTFYQV